MKPKLDMLGASVPTYGLLYGISYLVFLVALAMLLRRRRENLAGSVDLAILMSLSYTIGARLLGAIAGAEWGLFTEPTAAKLEGNLWGGQLAFGAVALVYLVLCRAAFAVLADALAVGWAGATVLHKIGCFFAGCCDGAPTSLPWAVVFPPNGQARLPGTPVHPTQLYDAGSALILCAALGIAFGRGRGRGRLLLWWGLAFGATRFVAEWVRGAPRFPIAGAVDAAMIFEWIAILACGALLASRGPWDRLAAWHDRRLHDSSPAPEGIAAPRRVVGAWLGDTVVAVVLMSIVSSATRSAALGVAVWVGYHVAANAALGASPIARILGLRSAGARGAAPGLARRAFRGLVESMTPLTLLGFVRPWMDRTSRTIADSLAGTFMVRRTERNP